MSVTFSKVKWKNILSTGNNFTEVVLNSKSKTLIVGENGSGKSTILDAICFGLFNRPFRQITKGQLVNSVNERDAEVEVYFSVGGQEFKIIRGIKPNKFEIYCNGTMINQDAAAKDYQKHLEENILKLNYRSFTQVVILGASTFVPFMKLSSAHRREVVEEILDIKIFSVMNHLLKTRLKDVASDIVSLGNEYKLHEQKIEQQQRHLKDLQENKDKIVNENNKKIARNVKSILSKQDTVTKLEIQSEKYFKEIEEQPIIDKKLKKLNRLHNTISEKQKRIETEVDFFNDNEECPTCEQHIDSDFKTKAIEVRTKKLQEYINGLKDIDKDIDTNEKELNTIINISEKIKSNDIEIGKLTSSIEELENFNTEYENEVKDLTDKDVTEKQLNELTSLQESLVSLGKRKAEMIEDKHYNDVVRNMLQDTGIKTKIVKRYLPVMNKLINGYLSSMDFFINFTIDENFNEVIKSRYRDEFKYYSFSEGEKMRIDLALLFTWRAIAKMKNSTNTNLLLLDEIFDSSLDGTGTDDFLKILNTFQKENVFVISHKGDVLYDKFAHILKFEKIQNFSKTIDVA